MTAPAWLDEELKIWAPPERIKISQWAERNRVLGRHSAIKGPYRLDMVPFLVPIFNACQDPLVDEVVLCASAQIGKTDGFLNIIGYYADQEPCSMMVVLADEKTASYVSTEKIQAMFEDSPKFDGIYDKRSASKQEIKLNNNTYISLGWASSVAQLASRPMRIVYFDEIDKEGYYTTSKEANPISLGRERTNTHPLGYYKHLLTSTPSVEEGNITTELDSCDVIYDWHVPCPSCGQRQPLRWGPGHCRGFDDGVYRDIDGERKKIGGVVWDGGKKATNQQIIETSRYACGECGSLWTTAEKNKAVRLGCIVPRTEEIGFERKIGFHVNRICSLFDGGRLEELVKSWVRLHKLSGQKKRKELQGFINSTLAEPWKEVVVQTKVSDILRAKTGISQQVVPEEAVALTAGIDVQKHGFWFTVRAWAKDYTNWLVHYGFLQTYEEVESLLYDTSYPVGETGNNIGIWRAGIDTGGGLSGYTDMSMTEQTYWWLRRNLVGKRCQVFGTKGSPKPIAGKIQAGKTFDKTPSGKSIPGGLKLFHIYPDPIKDILHERLRIAVEEGGPFSSYLNKDTGDDYVAQILAEEKRVNEKGVAEWVAVRKDNHLLDCEVIAFALAEPEWPGGGINILAGKQNVVEDLAIKPKKKKRTVRQNRKRW